MKLETFELLSAGEWVRVKGLVNPKGWLEWQHRDGSGGLARPGKFRLHTPSPSKPQR